MALLHAGLHQRRNRLEQRRQQRAALVIHFGDGCIALTGQRLVHNIQRHRAVALLNLGNPRHHVLRGPVLRHDRYLQFGQQRLCRLVGGDNTGFFQLQIVITHDQHQVACRHRTLIDGFSQLAGQLALPGHRACIGSKALVRGVQRRQRHHAHQHHHRHQKTKRQRQLTLHTHRTHKPSYLPHARLE